MEKKRKICIVGYPQLTTNYEAAFSTTDFEIALPLKDVSIFDWNTTPFAFHALIDSCDMLILPGGGDIDPSFFHQTNTNSHNVDFILDNVQLAFLEAFSNEHKPIIGICKGMQLINVFFGGELVQDLPKPSLDIHAYKDCDRSHPLYPNTVPLLIPWISALPQLSSVNSAHHQAISQLGNMLYPVHYAQDGIIETICHRSLPIIGTQWHPERLFINGANQLTPIVEKLFSAINLLPSEKI